MKEAVEFVMWLAMTHPDCLVYVENEDFGKKKFEQLYKEFIKFCNEKAKT